MTTAIRAASASPTRWYATAVCAKLLAAVVGLAAPITCLAVVLSWVSKTEGLAITVSVFVAALASTFSLCHWSMETRSAQERKQSVRILILVAFLVSFMVPTVTLAIQAGMVV